jgi:hypothetical protein
MQRADLTTRRRLRPSARVASTSRVHARRLARGSRRWAIRWAKPGRIGPYRAHHHSPATLPDIAYLQVLSGSTPPRTPCFTRERSLIRTQPRPLRRPCRARRERATTKASLRGPRRGVVPGRTDDRLAPRRHSRRRAGRRVRDLRRQHPSPELLVESSGYSVPATPIRCPSGSVNCPTTRVPLADIALRDFGLLLGALTLARLASAYPARTPSGRRDSR